MKNLSSDKERKKMILAFIFFWKNGMETRTVEPKEPCHSAKETTHDLEEIDPNRDYYHLYNQLYTEALKLKRQLSAIESKESRITHRVKHLSQRSQNFKDCICPWEEKPKKFERRGSDQILKRFICPFARCKHAYGSETAFRRHLKMKHPDEYNPKKRGRAVNSSGPINDVIQL